MTALPALFGNSTDFILEVRETDLEPDYAAGDHVTVKEQATCEPGAVAVVLLDAAKIREWCPDLPLPGLLAEAVLASAGETS